MKCRNDFPDGDLPSSVIRISLSEGESMNARKPARVCVLFVILSLLITQSIIVNGLAQYQAYLPLLIRQVFMESRGVLDPSFGEDGIVSTNFGPYAVAAINDLALQPDGKIVVAGYAETGEMYNFDLTVGRYLPDGSLDAAFGAGGIVMTDITSFDSAFAVVLQVDGKILAAGVTNDDDNNVMDGMVLVRYNPDGSLDTEFGDGGVVLGIFGAGTDAKDLALQTDGKILVAGSTYIEVGKQSIQVFLLARYNTDGSLDTSFDGDGWVGTIFGYDDDNATSLAVQPDGRILVGGASRQGGQRYYALARYHPDGSLDTSFAEQGKLVSQEMQCQALPSYAMVLQPDGKIVAVCGIEIRRLLLARFNTDGSLDSGFGKAGLVRRIGAAWRVPPTSPCSQTARSSPRARALSARMASATPLSWRAITPTAAWTQALAITGWF
jgi:uncharacterized delta-60 repeat protein